MAKNVMLALGWILALVLGGVLYVELQTVHALNQQVKAIKSDAIAARDAAAQMVDLEKRYATLESKLADLQGAATAGVEAAKSVAAKAEMPEGVDATALLKNIFADKGETPPANPLQAMFEGERGEKLMESNVGMTMNMQYRELFDLLGLNEERTEALRVVLTDHLRASMKSGLAFMRGEQGGVENASDDAENLLAAVGEILDPNELELFEQYQGELPERMMRQGYEMQLGMFAPGLSEETRQRTIDVLVEAVDPTSMEVQGNPADFLGNLDEMRARYDAVATQMESEVSAEDGAAIRAFINQQIAGLEMVSAMMGQEENESEDTP
jgi:hypothetical protein